jgi:hypothetical protein
MQRQGAALRRGRAFPFVGLTRQFLADVEANWRTKTFGDPSDSKSTVMASSISTWVLRQEGASPGFSWAKKYRAVN